MELRSFGAQYSIGANSVASPNLPVSYNQPPALPFARPSIHLKPSFVNTVRRLSQCLTHYHPVRLRRHPGLVCFRPASLVGSFGHDSDASLQRTADDVFAQLALGNAEAGGAVESVPSSSAPAIPASAAQETSLASAASASAAQKPSLASAPSASAAQQSPAPARTVVKVGFDDLEDLEPAPPPKRQKTVAAPASNKENVRPASATPKKEKKEKE